jgi:CheY-like chemotaxis protein
LVDDEKRLIDSCSQMLERLGYTVVSGTSSIEMLETFRAQPDKFDLVVTDQTMPQMTGLQLAEQLLRIRPILPIILCTGFSENVTAQKAKEIGVRELLMKPFSTEDLARLIRCIMDK